MNPQDSLTSIKGIGPKRAEIFHSLGIETVGALLYYFPRTYASYPEAVTELTTFPDEAVALRGRITKKPINRHTRRIVITTAYLLVGDLQIDLVWFNSAHIAKSILPEGDYVFYGKLKEGKSSIKMEHPIVFTREKYEALTGRPQPIYPLTKGIKNQTIISAIKSAFETMDTDIIGDYLPDSYTQNSGLMGVYEALYTMHFPEDYDSLKEARKRLVFDEFFMFLLEMNQNKSIEEATPNNFTISKDENFKKLKESLPFELTKGQNETLEDIVKDLKGRSVTQRLIQGDVGSGKTIIAILAMLLCAENGYKSAIMAPTEVLATQHYNNFVKFLADLNIQAEAVLLTGKLKASEKREVKERLKTPGPLFLIGTHALIQDDVDIPGLALVIIDEQHRFGVAQRKALSTKGMDPFYLVMSATPIPRSLAKILYSDMNISVIEDVPKKRLPIKNCILKEDMRTKAYQFLLKEIERKHQGYIICPLVEKSEKTEAMNVTEYYDKLTDIFPPNIRIGLLHGRMKPQEKNVIMDEFSMGNLDILISTTVIEVGIDVPNATVIIIENANRFGLAQLHQLRGRVGRGDAQSYCIFMNDKDEKNERLEVINSSNDGFFIANEDLRLRGPGELNGLRQSGELGFRLADIYSDADVLKLAASLVEDISRGDVSFPSLTDLYLQLHSSNSWYNI